MSTNTDEKMYSPTFSGDTLKHDDSSLTGKVGNVIDKIKETAREERDLEDIAAAQEVGQDEAPPESGGPIL